MRLVSEDWISNLKSFSFPFVYLVGRQRRSFQRTEKNSLRTSLPFFRMFALLSLFVLFALCNNDGLSVEQIRFNAFIKKYQKKYTKEEYLDRFEIFQDNLETIAKLNKLGKGSVIYGVNKFADLSAEEFRAQYLMPKGIW